MVIPFIFQDAEYNTVSSPAVHGRHMIPENTFFDTTDGLHRCHRSFIGSICPELHSFHLPFFKGKTQQQPFAMTVKTSSLEGLPVPGKPELRGLINLLYVIEARTAHIGICFFVKDNEGIFFFHVPVPDSFLEIV